MNNILSATGTGDIPHPFQSSQTAMNTQHFVESLNYTDILISLSTAAILAALLAYHPKRQVETGGPVNDKELKQNQILICVAGATLVCLIRGSLELSFGLVGLGGLVRYRTSMRNPTDLSFIFILIGLGMSCGLQFYKFAITIAGFIYVLLYVLDFSGGAYKNIWVVRVSATNISMVENQFKSMAKDLGFHIISMKTSVQTGRFRCRFTSKTKLISDELTQNIRERCGEDVLFTRIDWELVRD